MKHILTAIKDIKAGIYIGAIMPVRAEIDAQRHFMNMLTHSNSNVLKEHPKDFHMHVLGIFDDETGVLEHDGPPRDITPHSQIDDYVSRKDKP